MATGSIQFGTGMSSGIDWGAVTEALIGAERQPLTALQSRVDKYNSAKRTFSDVQSKLATLDSKLQALRFGAAVGGKIATVSGLATGASSPFNVTAGAAALAGSYKVEVLDLAQAHRVRSNAVMDPYSPVVADGTITVKAGDEEAITIDVSAANGNNNLNAIATQINQADKGVQASVIQDGTGAILVLKSASTGTANALTITDTTNLGLNPATNPTHVLQAAQNARIKVDDIEITSQSNEISTAIPGVSMTLTAKTTAAVSLDVADDLDSTKKALREFVDAYNSVNAVFQNQLGSKDAQSKSVVASSGVFRSIQQKLQMMVGASVEGLSSTRLHSFAELGVGIADNTGKLEFDEERFDDMIEAGRFDEIKAVLQSTGTGSTPSLGYVASTSSVEVGTYNVTIQQAAEQAVVTGAHAVDAGGLAANETMSITVGSTTTTVDLLAGDTLSAIVSKINTKLGQAGVAAAALATSDGKLQLRSREYGAAQSLTVSSTAASALTDAGFKTAATDTGLDVKGWIGGDPLVDPVQTGSGQDLAGIPGTATEGLTIRVYGTGTGQVGTMTYSQGMADQFADLVEQLTDPLDGTILSAQNEYNTLIKQAEDRMDAIETRLAKRRETLTRTFAAAEASISQLNSMLSQLSQGLK